VNAGSYTKSIRLPKPQYESPTSVQSASRTRRLSSRLSDCSRAAREPQSTTLWAAQSITIGLPM
jgi:hypothetical protein